MQFLVCPAVCLASLIFAFSASGYVIRHVRQAEKGSELLVSEVSFNQSAQLWESRILPEAYLGPAPVSIALMGQLLVICSKTDVSLAERPPVGGYRFIRYPSSLRASLVQLATEAWDTFHDAFRTMSFLQSEMQQVPIHLRTIVRILKSAPISIMSNMTSISLKLIRSTGEKAALRAQGTADKFGLIMNLTGEIAEAVQACRGDYDKQLWNAEVESMQNEIMKNATDRQIQELEKKQREIDEEVRQADADYAKAIKDLPTGWKALGLLLGNALVRTIETVIPIVAGGTKGITGIISSFLAGKQPPGDPTATASGAANGLRLQTIDYKEASQVLDIVSSIGNFIEKPASSAVEAVDEFSRKIKTVLEALSRSIASVQGQRIRDLIEKAKGIVDRLNNGTISEGVAIKKDIAELNMAALHLYAEAEGQQQGAVSTHSRTQSLTNQKGPFANEKLKVFLAMEKANKLAKTQMEIFNSRLNEYRAYYDIIGRLATLDIRTVRFDEIIKMLKEAANVMSQLRYHWASLVQFFDRMTQQVDKAVQHSIMPLADAVALAGATGMDAAGRNYISALVVDDANGILSQAYFLRLMAGMYLDVHSRHINTQLAGLSSLATVAPEHQNATMQALLQQAVSAETDIKSRLMQQVTQQQARISDVVAEAQRELRQTGATTIGA
ncbi:uncharacterized protein LOC129597812 [Paramacrobiotus metropolitanus]|uniref:uncharacterized protein LOC129597812 n=1 Tax=Paramacrobiotus metropolitanus TaxID=2943436 RepID=UPI0024465C23|nr:uncharacterized protein LOC129597812 [Paramacrobiotus metropolitanus]